MPTSNPAMKPRRITICLNADSRGACNGHSGDDPAVQRGADRCAPRGSCRSFNLDLALHGGMQAADVVVDTRIRERELGGLALQDNGRAKPLGAGDGHLMW